MRPMLTVPATLLSLLIAPPSVAHDGSGSFGVRGAGSASCSAYLSATPQQKKHAETWWAGYLTAMNRTTPRTYDLLGNVKVASANRWLEAWCRKNPKKQFAVAVHEMLRAAYPNRQQTRPK